MAHSTQHHRTPLVQRRIMIKKLLRKTPKCGNGIGNILRDTLLTIAYSPHCWAFSQQQFININTNNNTNATTY